MFVIWCHQKRRLSILSQGILYLYWLCPPAASLTTDKGHSVKYTARQIRQRCTWLPAPVDGSQTCYFNHCHGPCVHHVSCVVALQMLVNTVKAVVSVRLVHCHLSHAVLSLPKLHKCLVFSPSVSVHPGLLPVSLTAPDWPATSPLTPAKSGLLPALINPQFLGIKVNPLWGP